MTSEEEVSVRLDVWLPFHALRLLERLLRATIIASFSGHLYRVFVCCLVCSLPRLIASSVDCLLACLLDYSVDCLPVFLCLACLPPCWLAWELEIRSLEAAGELFELLGSSNISLWRLRVAEPALDRHGWRPAGFHDSRALLSLHQESRGAQGSR